MQIDVTRLVYWKTEHTEEDNEDACGFNATSGLFAVADGVGEASFSYQWAPVLVQRFLDEPLFSEEPFEVEHWVRAAQYAGKDVITPAESLEGVARTKARMGAAATLLGLMVFPREGGLSGPPYSYRVVAIGDSNFFHWRLDKGRYQLLAVFPITESRGFGTLPSSINSRTFDRYATYAGMFYAQSDPIYDLQDGDLLMLATDALAQWTLRECEAARDPLPTLLEQSEETWPQFIEGLREERQIVNDDSTLLLISIRSVLEGDPLQAADYSANGAIALKRTDELWQGMKAYELGETRDVELALAYGDGARIQPAIRCSRYVAPYVTEWRERADAFKRVSDCINVFMRHPERRVELEAAWAECRDTLVRLHWTGPLLSTMRSLGIGTEAAQPAGSGPPLPDEESANPTPLLTSGDATITEGDTDSEDNAFSMDTRRASVDTSPQRAG